MSETNGPKPGESNQLADVIRSALGQTLGTHFQSDFLKSIRIATENYQSLIGSLATPLAPFITASNPFLKQLEVYGKIFVQALERHQEMQKDINSKLRKQDLFLSPYFYTLTTPALYRLFCVDGVTPIEAIDTYFSNDENTEALLKYWNDSASHAARLHLFRPAIQAHLRKDYTLSIPVFLSQIDGILAEHLGTSKDHRYGPLLEKDQARRPEGEGLDTLYWEMRGPDLLIQAITEQLFNHSAKYEKIEKKLYPNRHAILHGNDLNYHNIPFGSLRCILVLDWLTNPRDDHMRTGDI